MAQDLGRAAAGLPGLTDSDSDSSLAGDPEGQGDPGGRSPSPDPLPAGGPAGPPPDVPMPQVWCYFHTYMYIQSHTNIYIHYTSVIHTDTYRYIQIPT